jgi:hypothetical protein
MVSYHLQNGFVPLFKLFFYIFFGGQCLYFSSLYFSFLIVCRVTRLGEFSPIGRLFSQGIFSKTDKNYALIFANNWLGYILGDSFKSSSGHPDCM